MLIENLLEHFSDDIILDVVSEKDENNRVDNLVVGKVKCCLLSKRTIKDWNFDGILHIIVIDTVANS